MQSENLLAPFTIFVHDFQNSYPNRLMSNSWSILTHPRRLLLLLTTDGQFANKIMHPSHKIKKTYRVWLDRKLSAADKNPVINICRLDAGALGSSVNKLLERNTLIPSQMRYAAPINFTA